jgi:hypothetical protein
MRRHVKLPVVILALATGCAGSTEPPRQIPGARAAAEPSQTEAWQVVRAPLEGISVAMPPEAKETYSSDDQNDVLTYTIRLTRRDHGMDYMVSRLRFLHTAKRNTVEQARALFKHIDETRPMTIQGHSGTALQGTSLHGERVKLRVFEAGTCVYMLGVTVAAGAPMNEQNAARFFDSFHFDVPWELFASERGRFVVAVPAIAKRMDIPVKGADESMRFFLMNEQRGYAIAYFEIGPEALQQESADELLDASIMRLANVRDATIEKFKTIELHGIPGREAIVRLGEGKHSRIRSYLAGARLYLIQVIAGSSEPLRDGDADRFLDSFRIGQAP